MGLSNFTESDSVRIRIVSGQKVVLDEKIDSYVKAYDINGWYFKVENPGAAMSGTDNQNIKINNNLSIGKRHKK
jgi:hypothetical protein